MIIDNTANRMKSEQIWVIFSPEPEPRTQNPEPYTVLGIRYLKTQNPLTLRIYKENVDTKLTRK